MALPQTQFRVTANRTRSYCPSKCATSIRSGGAYSAPHRDAHHHPNLLVGNTNASMRLPRRHKGRLHTAIASPTEYVQTETQSVPASETEESTFNWQKQWYPVVPVGYLDPKKPHPLTLLGQPIVMFRDNNDQWNVLEDRCPHRLAPLSEGRIETDGTLQCAYHGWRFDSQGKAVLIPQLGDPAAQQTACSSQRSCAKPYPSKVLQGILWVWADNSPTAFQDSQARDPPTCPELDDPEWSAPSADWFFRDVPYNIETLLENLFDPSHIPFAHHGIMGAADRSKAVPLEIETVEDVTPQGGFVLTRNSAPFKTQNQSVSVNTFAPPTLCRSKQTMASGRAVVLQFYATPLRPGWTRLHTAFLASFKLPRFARALLPLAEWWFHRGQNLVLDSDSYILHVQEKQLKSEGGDWKKSFYLPAGADLGVIKYRTWFHKMAGGGVSWPAHVKPEDTEPLPREVVLDRYEQHVKSCKYCRSALAWIQRAQVVCAALGAVTAGALGWQAAAGALLKAKTGAVVVFGALVMAALWKLKQLQREFYFTDYVHAEAH